MSIYKNGKLIAGGRQCMPLLSFMWADHILNDASWLRADTFSWQTGSMYQAVYQHLADDIANAPLIAHEINGITVWFYLADDGHRICSIGQESNVQAIYEATGVAWYYIIDTANQRFKLPRTKFGFTGLRNAVGNYVAPELPNITGTIGFARSSDSAKGNVIYNTGAFYSSDTYTGGGYSTFAQDGNSPAGNKRALFDASHSDSTYKDGATVQPPATQMYLYFYVGQFTQTALENTAGVTTEVLNTKVTVGHQVIDFQEPTVNNGYTWYRKYADGWVEQGGVAIITANGYLISLPITMTDTNYVVYSIVMQNTGAYNRCYNRTTTRIGLASSGGNNTSSWLVMGMAAN